jgi:hypothetical protein
VKEESQIEEMRAAVRGDRERAEQARRRSLENVRTLVEPPTQSAPAPASERRRGLLGFLRRR